MSRGGWASRPRRSRRIRATSSSSPASGFWREHDVMRRAWRGGALAAVMLALLIPAAARAAETAPAEVDLIWGARIPMRDGVQLNATIYKPRGAAPALPAIFTLTPYIADSYHARAIYFARHGYIFALVDVRGRGS